jgi:nicotinamide-nucleotide amidase
MRRGANPEVGTVVTSGVVQVRIVARDKDLASAREKVEAVATQARRLLGVAVIGEGDATLPSAVAELLERTGRTIAIAESCTGGLVAGMLTEEAGISRFFLEGVVAYSNAAKTRLLGVPEALLNAYGAVSLQAASAMARGVREKSRADIGVAITGIAGPGGGTREKPAGTVCFALDDDAGTITREERFAGDRAEVRDRAAKTALNMVRVRLLGARR